MRLSLICGASTCAAEIASGAENALSDAGRLDVSGRVQVLFIPPDWEHPATPRARHRLGRPAAAHETCNSDTLRTDRPTSPARGSRTLGASVPTSGPLEERWEASSIPDCVPSRLPSLAP